MNYFDNALSKIAENKKSHFRLFLPALILLTAVMMLSYYPLFPGHDFFFHFHRLEALIYSLKTTFPYYVDTEALLGYGYFTKAFYCDILLVPFAIIGIFTDALTAYQSMIFTITVLCGIFTYQLVNVVFKNSFAAVVSGILYTFCIYRLLDMYHRSAIGETISFTFVPIVLLGLYYIIRDDYGKWYVFTIGMTLMIFTHVIATVLMSITAGIILLLSAKRLIREPKRILWLAIASIVALILTSYYLWPLLEQIDSQEFYYQTRNITSNNENEGFYPHWIIWGMFSGIIHPSQIFIPGTGLLLTAVIALRVFIKGKSTELRLADYAVILGLIYIFAISRMFPWGVFPLNKLNFIQFPWRFLEFSSILFAIAGGYYLSQLVFSLRRGTAILAMVVFAVVLVMVSDGRAYNKIRNGRSLYEKRESARWDNFHLGGIEYIPDNTPNVDYLVARGKRIDCLHDSTKISYPAPAVKSVRKHVTEFDVSTSEKETLVLPLLYYKGYKASLNGSETTVRSSSDGLVEIDVPQSGTVKVWYGGTLVQKVSFYISLVSLLILGIYIIYIRKKNRKKEKDYGL